MDRKIIELMTRSLTDQGKIIEAGWLSLQHIAIPSDADELQLKQLRMAFFAGAQHLFSSIMIALDDSSETSESDLRRMDMIDKELGVFLTEFKREHNL